MPIRSMRLLCALVLVLLFAPDTMAQDAANVPPHSLQGQLDELTAKANVVGNLPGGPSPQDDQKY